MLDFSRRLTVVLAVCMLVGFLVGCGGGEPTVVEGRYRAWIEGSLTDTLTGPAVYRELPTGGVGIELGTQGGSGLSIELGPRPLRSRSYDVVAAELFETPRADSLPGAMVFLAVGRARFEAVRGTVSLSHVGDGEVRGSLDVVMEGESEGPTDELSVRVTGTLKAIPE